MTFRHATATRRARSRSRLARPYIWRLRAFSLLIWPSVCPLAARPRRSRPCANLAIRYAGSKGRQADRSVRRHQRPAGAGGDPIRPRGAGRDLAVEQRVPFAQLHNPLGRHPEGQDLSTDRPGRRSGRRPTSWKLHNRRAAPARPWHATERMSPGPFGRRGRARENSFRCPAGRPRMTYSKTVAIRTAIAVIATLLLAGCMSGDHGVKRMAAPGAWRYRPGKPTATPAASPAARGGY